MNDNTNDNVGQASVLPQEFWDALELICETQCEPYFEREDKGEDVEQLLGEDVFAAMLLIDRWLRTARSNKWFTSHLA